MRQQDLLRSLASRLTGSDAAVGSRMRVRPRLVFQLEETVQSTARLSLLYLSEHPAKFAVVFVVVVTVVVVIVVVVVVVVVVDACSKLWLVERVL